jgi:hypothetical protein
MNRREILARELCFASDDGFCEKCDKLCVVWRERLPSATALLAKLDAAKSGCAGCKYQGKPDDQMCRYCARTYNDEFAPTAAGK